MMPPPVTTMLETARITARLEVGPPVKSSGLVIVALENTLPSGGAACAPVPLKVSSVVRVQVTDAVIASFGGGVTGTFAAVELLNAGPQGLDLLEAADHFRSADIVDPDLAAHLRVHLADPGVGHRQDRVVLGNERDGAQRLRAGGARQGQRAGNGKRRDQLHAMHGHLLDKADSLFRTAGRAGAELRRCAKDRQ